MTGWLQHKANVNAERERGYCVGACRVKYEAKPKRNARTRHGEPGFPGTPRKPK